MAAMQAFLDDYELGKRQGRYVNAELPTLPFENGTFHLALCSHFLFLYSTQLGEAFHRAAIHEMCRVAVEVRIFPLLALGCFGRWTGSAGRSISSSRSTGRARPLNRRGPAADGRHRRDRAVRAG